MKEIAARLEEKLNEEKKFGENTCTTFRLIRNKEGKLRRDDYRYIQVK